MGERTSIACKDCGAPVSFTTDARVLDLARGLSAPERCPKCRKKNREHINSTGQAYWHPKVETDDAKRCWGKFGLGRLERDRPAPKVEAYSGIPTAAPLWYLKDPKDPRIQPEHLKLAEKFSKIAPVAEKLIANLTDPRGTRVTVLVGPTGTGKSTWVPYRLLRSPIGEHGRIIVTQPRTITLRQEPGAKEATTTPGYIASKLLGQPPPWLGPGQEIGYRYSEEREMYDAYTKLLFVTDGTLINWIQSGEVGAYSVVMIDEAHEQSVNMELIFALLKYRLALYPHLRIVIASATVDIDKFRNYFGNGDPSSVFLAEPDNAAALATGTLKTIHDRFMAGNTPATLDFAKGLPEVQALEGLAPQARLKQVPAAVAALVKAICTRPGFTRLNMPKGDILVFVPRVERDMLPVEDAIKALRLDLEVFPCHAQLSDSAYAAYKQSDEKAEKAMGRGEPTRPQRVLLATTYAETSVTMSNLRYVIDTGLILQPVWDPETCSTTFESNWHSQDGCTQRKGRVGRVQEGECFRLYTKAEHDAMAVHTKPEITRVPLDSFLIKAKASGIDDLASFEWLGKTKEEGTSDAKEIRRAGDILRQRGVVDADGDITHRGLELSGFQTSTVDLALCMSESDTYGCTLEMATFLAFLGVGQGIFKKGDSGALGYVNWISGCRDDLELYLRLCHHWTHYDGDRPRDEWFAAQGLNPSFLADVEEGREKLVSTLSRRTHDSVTWRALDLDRIHRVRLVLGRCLPEWVYVKESEGGDFRPHLPEKCPCKVPLRIERESACLVLTDVKAFVCIGRTKLKKSGAVLAQHVVRLEEAWLPLLQSASPVSIATVLRDAPRSTANLAAGTAKAVASLPSQLPRLRPAPGQRLTLRAIKAVGVDEEGADGRAFLCEEVKTKQVAIVAFESDKRLRPGENFEAVTTRVADARVVVTQAPIIEDLARGGRVQAARVVNGDSNVETGEVFGLFVEIAPPGVQAKLPSYAMGFVEAQSLLRAKPGDGIAVVVVKAQGERCEVMTKAVAEGRRRRIQVGERFDGIVLRQEKYGAQSGRAGETSGWRVEIVPGRSGFLPAGALGRGGQGNVAAWQRGASIRVEVDRITEPEDSDPLLRIPRQTFAVGQVVEGTVVGLAADKNGYGPPVAYVELAPRVDGALFWKNAPRGMVSAMWVGQRVRVRILGPRTDRKDGYELGA